MHTSGLQLRSAVRSTEVALGFVGRCDEHDRPRESGCGESSSGVFVPPPEGVCGGRERQTGWTGKDSGADFVFFDGRRGWQYWLDDHVVWPQSCSTGTLSFTFLAKCRSCVDSLPRWSLSTPFSRIFSELCFSKGCTCHCS